jgi:hypothetical protein
MKKILPIAALIVITLFSSCNNYGKKVKINEYLEVYLKGDSVSENDAHKLGDYLASISKESTNEKSLQLSKEKGAYVVRMVIDENKLKTDTTLNTGFMALKTLIGSEVFPGSNVNFIVTDNQFKDLKTY